MRTIILWIFLWPVLLAIKLIELIHDALGGDTEWGYFCPSCKGSAQLSRGGGFVFCHCRGSFPVSEAIYRPPPKAKEESSP